MSSIINMFNTDSENNYEASLRYSRKKAQPLNTHRGLELVSSVIDRKPKKRKTMNNIA